MAVRIRIDRADSARVGDTIIIAIHNEQSERGIHCVGKIENITKPNPHPDITEFTLNCFADVDGDTGRKLIGMRHERKICILGDG